MKLREYLAKSSPSLLVVTAYVLVGLIGTVDYVTGREISLSIFYLFPVSLITWSIDKRSGIVISVFSAIAWLGADFMSGHTYSHSIIPFWNMLVRLCFFLIVVFLISTVKHLLKESETLAKTDFLTGVSNARYFFELANTEINRSGRFNHPFTLIYVDIDDFKLINDRHGHNTGDELLRTIASIFRSNLRRIDLVARLGGDEFAVLLPETGAEQSQIIIRKMQKTLAEVTKKNNWHITFSMGVVTFLRPPVSVDNMIKIADDLMYAAKHAGKNAIKEKVIGG